MIDFITDILLKFINRALDVFGTEAADAATPCFAIIFFAFANMAISEWILRLFPQKRVHAYLHAATRNSKDSIFVGSCSRAISITRLARTGIILPQLVTVLGFAFLFVLDSNQTENPPKETVSSKLFLSQSSAVSQQAIAQDTVKQHGSNCLRTVIIFFQMQFVICIVLSTLVCYISISGLHLRLVRKC